MRRVARIVVLLLLAALPLRGYAALALALCEKQHGGTALMHHVQQHHGAAAAPLPEGSKPTEGFPSLTMCGLCAGCCVGASLGVDAAQPALPDLSPPQRIPFLDAVESGHIPPPLARPPLVS